MAKKSVGDLTKSDLEGKTVLVRNFQETGFRCFTPSQYFKAPSFENGILDL